MLGGICMEYWKTIEGYEDYEVSSLGRIRSNKPNRKSIILKERYSKDGYIQYALLKKRKS